MIVAAGGGERDGKVDITSSRECASAPNPRRYLNQRLMSDLRPTLFLTQLSNLMAGNISIVHGVTGSSRTFMGEEARRRRRRAYRPCAHCGRSERPRACRRRLQRRALGSRPALCRSGTCSLTTSTRMCGSGPRPAAAWRLALWALFWCWRRSSTREQRGAKPFARLAGLESDHVTPHAGRRHRDPGALVVEDRRRREAGTSRRHLGRDRRERATSEERAFLQNHAGPCRACDRHPSRSWAGTAISGSISRLPHWRCSADSSFHPADASGFEQPMEAPLTSGCCHRRRALARRGPLRSSKPSS